MGTTYVVFEGGGIEYDPKIHGVFENKWQAKECLKSVIQDFLEINLIPVFDENNNSLIDKEYSTDYTYFYIYQDVEEKEHMAYINVFVLAEFLCTFTSNKKPLAGGRGI